MRQFSREDLAAYLNGEYDDPLNHPNFTTLLLMSLQEPALTAFYIGGVFKQLSRLGFKIGDENLTKEFNDNWMTAWDIIFFSDYEPDPSLEVMALNRLTRTQASLYKAYHKPNFFKHFDDIRKRKTIQKN